jgi:predicted RND superfamily exporter protein
LAFGNDIQKEQYSEYQSAFKQDKSAITIGLKKEGLFSTYSDFLAVQALTSSLETLAGVKKVVSIENINSPVLSRTQNSNTLFLPLKSKDAFEEAYNILDKFLDITEKFLSEDRTGLSFYVYLNDSNQDKTIASIDSSLIQSVFTEYHVLGAPVFNSEGNRVLKQETFTITILGILLLLTSMLLLTPSIRRIGITLLFTIFNVCVTLIFMYVFKYEITSFTTLVPIIIAILSFTDITHILHHYEHLVSQNTPKSVLKRTLFKKIGFPLLLTSLSNLFGFIIFFFNGGIHQITDLAIVASFGIIFAYFSSRFILPFVLDYEVLLSSKQRLFIDLLISRCTDFVGNNHKLIVLGFAILLAILSLWAMNASTIDMHYYEKDNNTLAINRACAFYDESFQGIRDIEVVINTESVLRPSIINTIDSIETYLLTYYGCKTTYSLNTIIKRFERTKNSGHSDAFVLPKIISSDLIDELEQNQDELRILTVMSKNKQTTRIIGSLPDIGTQEALVRNKKLSNFVSKFNTSENQIYLNGKAYLFDRNVNGLTRFVLLAILIGILITGLITSVLFKSFWVGLIAIIANLLPLLFAISMMIFLEIDLNPYSIFILTIVFGVALDDSIYLLGHLYNSHPDRLFTKQTILSSVKTNSSPLLITSIVLSILFLALTISSYHSLFSFGVIVSASLIFAFISDLLLIPSLLLLSKSHNN